MFTGWEKRDGYFRVSAEDSVRLAGLAGEAGELIGEFEKPIYVDYDAALCAHSRNSLNGCSRCLDVCPAGAIISAGDTVEIDPAICGGCGYCGAVCPSGAAQTALPPADAFLQQMNQLLDHYLEAGGKAPRLLLTDDGYGTEMIEMMARFGPGLPATMLPMTMHSVGRVGHDILVTAIAQGFEQVAILTNPKKADEAPQIARQIEFARALLQGVKADDDNRVILIDAADPEIVASQLRDSLPGRAFKAAPFSPLEAPAASPGLPCAALPDRKTQRSQPSRCLTAPPMAGLISTPTIVPSACPVLAPARQERFRTTLMRHSFFSAKMPACNAASVLQHVPKR